MPEHPQVRVEGSDSAKRPPVRACPAEANAGLVAIVLAAGRSARMAPHDKLLRLREGVPVLRRVVGTVLERVADVRVVVRPEADAARAALADLPVRLIDNPAAGEGMASSIRAGLRSLSTAPRGVLIVLADMPCVTADHLQRLIDAFLAAGCGNTAVPVFDGRRGNPVLWSAAYLPALQALSGDVGARELLLRDAASLIRVEMPDDGVLLDIDTADDWNQWLSRPVQAGELAHS